MVFDDADGNSLTLKGPAHSDNSFEDDTEQYFWTPDNFSDWNAYWNSAHTALTLTLDDGVSATAPSFTDPTGDAQTWTQNEAIAAVTFPLASGTPTPTYAVVGSLPPGIAINYAFRIIAGTPTTAGSGTITIRATNSEGAADWTVDYTTASAIAAVDHAVDAGPVSWVFDVPQPTVTRTAAIPLLMLADLPTAGLDVVTGALLVASAPGTAVNNLYADSDRGGSDSPLDGELGLSSTETVISRIRRLEATMFVINDNDNPNSLALNTYFGAGGDGNDLTLYLQTVSDGLVSFAVSDQLDTSGGNFARFILPADAQTLLDNIDTGDRWIFALARPATAAVAHTVDAGTVAWTFDVPQPTVTRTPAAIDHMVDAGAVSWTFNVPEPTVTRTAGPVAHTVDAGPVSWNFDVPEPTVTRTPPGSVAHAVDAGNVLWTFDIPQPTVTRTPATLTLADFTLPAGLTTPDVLALFTAEAPTDVYVDSNRGGSQTPDAGELGVGVDQVLITRIRILLNGAQIALNSSDVPVVLDLGAYFGIANTESDWTLIIQTAGGQASTRQLASLGSVFAQFDFSDASDVALINAIGAGDSVIVAIAAMAYVPVDHTVDAGPVSWTFDVPEPTVTHTSVSGVDHTVDAGAVSWTFVVPEPTVTRTSRGPVNHTVDAGAVAWTFAVPQPTITHILPGGIDVGKAERLGLLQRITYQTNRIDLACKQWLGSDSDENRRNFIRWNFVLVPVLPDVLASRRSVILGRTARVGSYGVADYGDNDLSGA